jgi:glycosyltransferase involved in cell wall biosynthesis
VDDNSKDLTLPKTLDYLSRFSFTARVFSTKGEGLGYARQVVVDNASGKYILWIDGDMILPKNHMSLQVKFMEEHPDLGKARAVWKILNEKTLASMLESMRVLRRSIRRQRKEYAQGIGGSICRTDALRMIGGFDRSIRGAGEDIDLAVRLADSWKAGISEAVFYHHFRQTWRGLWSQYYWYGYGMHFVNNKHRGVVKLWTYSPVAALLAGMRQSFIAFKQTGRSIAFLLPIQFLFKHSAWMHGYFSSHCDGYGHFKN